MHSRRGAVGVANVAVLVSISISIVASCASVTGEPIAFATATRHDEGPAKPAGSAAGRSCESTIDLLFGKGQSSLAFRVDNGKPRSTQVALSDAMTHCRGCTWLADVAIETERSASFFGFFAEVCTTVSGTAMTPAS